MRVIGRESGVARICDIDEARAWDWRNPEIWSPIGNRVIFGFDSLLNILRHKAQKGVQEVEMIESPRFMMLSGG
jgi:hypothetical protein